MSTNPFRQIKPQRNQGNNITYQQSESAFGGSDGGGLTSKDLSVDTRVPPSSLDRHVSFASPPVDSTISAASYPSSPESARSPPVQYGQPWTPHTPDYRTALQSDPFDDLRQENMEDRTIWQALRNTQNNVMSEQTTTAVNQHNAVQNTLSRFASAPRTDPPSTVNNTTNHQVSSRQSMDVDAFKRLLLTGDSGQITPLVPPLGSIQPATKGFGDSGYGTGTASVSQSSVVEFNVLDTEEATKPFNDHEFSTGFSHKQIPPPAPAPRRGRSIKNKISSPVESTDSDAKAQQDRPEAEKASNKSITAKKPPTPPLARRQSYKIASSLRSEEANTSSSSNNDSDPSSTIAADHPQPPKGPPPPLIRRQGTTTNEVQRRVSHDLAPTVEEPAEADADNNAQSTTSNISSRKSSDAPLPPVPRSRNSSISTNRKNSVGGVGPMNPPPPPPVPPPRRGRGSSRSSFDSFSRPTVATLVGEENSNHFHRQEKERQKDVSTLNPSNANSILAELADLQREVDAARRGA